MKNIQKLKAELKTKAQNIKDTRARLKIAQRKGGYKAGTMQCGILSLIRDFRHHHIAYCELRGRTRDQIENPRIDNLPDESTINRIKEEYAWEIELENTNNE